jgi:adenylate cyclase class 2
MAIEIELKVRLDDPEPLKRRLSAVGAYCHSYEKSDVYWIAQERAGGPPAEQPFFRVRVRRELTVNADGHAGESTLVTYKTKTMRDGIELNDEREFAVTAAPGTDGTGVFEELLGRMGLVPDITKEKRGWAWNVDGQPPVLAELSMVTDLGWFLELEIMAESQDERTVTESRNRLLSLLSTLEIPPERIETRPYTEMLKAVPR